ncbi:hypothetical protein Tco_1385758 [Tanacetum coccineum]
MDKTTACSWRRVAVLGGAGFVGLWSEKSGEPGGGVDFSLKKKVVHNFVGVMEVEPDIENMTLEEYLKYESEKERRLWKSVRSKGSPIRYEGTNFDSFHREKSQSLEYPDSDEEIVNDNDEVDIDRLEDVQIDDLFKIGADNLRRMKQDEVQVATQGKRRMKSP